MQSQKKSKEKEGCARTRIFATTDFLFLFLLLVLLLFFFSLLLPCLFFFFSICAPADHMAECELEDEDYAWATTMLCEKAIKCCAGRIVSVLEVGMCTHARTHTHMHIRTHMHTCTHAHMHTCTHTCMTLSLSPLLPTSAGGL